MQDLSWTAPLRAVITLAFKSALSRPQRVLGTVLNSGLKSQSSSCQGRVRCPPQCSWSPLDVPWHCPHLSALGLPALGSVLLFSGLREPLKGRGQICLLRFVPSAQRGASPGTTTLVLFCGVEPSEVRVSQGYGASSLLRAQDPLELILSPAPTPTIPTIPQMLAKS